MNNSPAATITRANSTVKTVSGKKKVMRHPHPKAITLIPIYLPLIFITYPPLYMI